KFQNSDLREGEETKLQAGVYKKSDNTTIVAAATNEILYTGSINRDDDDSVNRFLLISNKKTGKVRLVPVDIAILAPQLNQKEGDVVDNANANSLNILNKEFGSKRIKRITEQRERLKMNINDVKEQLEKTVEALEIKESESFSMGPGENDSMYRPHINRDASTKEQVYVLNEIVPENVLNSLEEEAQHVLSSDLEQFDVSPFIKQHLIQLQNSSVASRIEKCELLLYLHYLITFVNKPAKNITKRFIICESSQDVNNHILDNFSVTSNTGRTRPLSMKDKAICHILVLSMIGFDYQLDIETLAKSMKLGIKKLQEMGRILAFSPHGKDKSRMVLKIPLPPAVLLSPKKRRR
ncbi:DNA-directed RNA polymerase I subunit RPA49-like, partial [Asbolus verrucosus]